MVQRLLELEAWCVAGLPADRVRAGRAALRFAWGVCPWGFAFAGAFALIGQPLLATSLVIAGLGVGLTPVILRLTRSVDVVAHWMNVFLAQSLLLGAWGIGGILAASIPWLALCIVIAAFLSGPRAGVVWTALGIGSVWFLCAVHFASGVPVDPVSPEIIWVLAATAHSGLFAVVLVFVGAGASVNARAQAELEQARAAADEANNAKSAFLAHMSHELRTPMNAIIGYAELLLEDADTDDRHDLDRIHIAGRHLLQLINEVLDLAKVDAGQMEFTSESVEVVAVSREVLDAAAPLLRAHDNRFVIDAERTEMWVRADPMRLRQCLLNLVSNAAKFTHDGTIRIRIRGAPETTISVEDTGTGIQPDQLTRIFEPFTQASAEVQRTHGGTGLGLALVKQFVDRMDGRVWVESRVGVGSTFHLALRAAAPSEVHADG